jgi:hypothetical protein
MLFPTTLVGSYPQPEWLIDRGKLAGRFPPRVRARELWRVPEPFLAEAQDDATIMAIKAQEEAGLDIITDGEMRRESYSNRFATALEGVDLDNPGMALDRSGHPNPVPRVVGKIRRRHAVQVRDVEFLRHHTKRKVKITVPGPFTMSQQAQIDYYDRSPEAAAMDYATAVNEEIRDLFAAGADVVQVDEPYMQARPDALRLRRHHPRTPCGLLFPAGTRGVLVQAGLARDRAVQSGLLGAAQARGQDDHPGGDRSGGYAGRISYPRGRANPSCAPSRRGRGCHHRPGLWHEVSTARGRLRKAVRHGRRRANRARGGRIALKRRRLAKGLETPARMLRALPLWTDVHAGAGEIEGLLPGMGSAWAALAGRDVASAQRCVVHGRAAP